MEGFWRGEEEEWGRELEGRRRRRRGWRGALRSLGSGRGWVLWGVVGMRLRIH